MLRTLLTSALIFAGACNASWSQTPEQGKAVDSPPANVVARPPRPVDPRYVDAPRARAPSLDLALEAATAAVAKCKTMNHKITVQITDAAGEPVVLLSGDGAGMRSLRLMKPKPFSVYRHKVASSKANESAKTDPVLADAIKADTAIGYGGALPILVGDELIGVITVSGTPTGALDEVCGQAGLDKISSRLK